MEGNNILGVVELTYAEDLLNRHGSASFDQILDTFFTRMQSWVRSKDEWSRLDDYRFCVTLNEITGRGELELAAAKLARIFEKPHSQDDGAIALEVCAGFTVLSGPQYDRNQALHEASLALKQAKSASQLFELYEPNSQNNAQEEREIVAGLYTALKLGELELYFQPKVNPSSHTLIGAEALMRWHTSRGEIVQPDTFIDIAERHDVIKPITWWAIKTSIARLARWSPELTIAVNVTPTLLLDDEILTVVKDSLTIHDVDPSRLTLEVTERVMVDHQQGMLRQLARLWRLGVKISLDDFGTGFSSLSYFRDLPVDEIKIDKDFVLRMLKSDKDMAIVKAIIGLAHTFDMKVVAEGVETLEIAQCLADLDCDVLQGYVFDRPLTVESFEEKYDVSSSA